MLRWRLLAAALLIGPLVGLLYLDFHWGQPALWLWPLPLIASCMAVSEILTMLRRRGFQPVAWSVYGGTALVTASALAPLFWQTVLGKTYPPDCPLGVWGWTAGALSLALCVAFAAEMRRYEKPDGQTVLHIALSVLIIVYIGLPFAFLAALRAHGSNVEGMAILVVMIFVAKMADTGAYTFGRLFGRRKMTPLLSPQKTIEGAVGGALTACVSAFAFFYWIGPSIFGEAVSAPWWGCLIFGVVISFAGMLGDLAESLLKRDTDCKDSSGWLPGLGGVLDIVDSLLFAAPPAYFCWRAGILF